MELVTYEDGVAALEFDTNKPLVQMADLDYFDVVLRISSDQHSGITHGETLLRSLCGSKLSLADKKDYFRRIVAEEEHEEPYCKWIQLTNYPHVIFVPVEIEENNFRSEFKRELERWERAVTLHNNDELICAKMIQVSTDLVLHILKRIGICTIRIRGYGHKHRFVHIDIVAFDLALQEARFGLHQWRNVFDISITLRSPNIVFVGVDTTKNDIAIDIFELYNASFQQPEGHYVGGNANVYWKGTCYSQESGGMVMTKLYNTTWHHVSSFCQYRFNTVKTIRDLVVRIKDVEKIVRMFKDRRENIGGFRIENRIESHTLLGAIDFLQSRDLFNIFSFMRKIGVKSSYVHKLPVTDYIDGCLRAIGKFKSLNYTFGRANTRLQKIAIVRSNDLLNMVGIARQSMVVTKQSDKDKWWMSTFQPVNREISVAARIGDGANTEQEMIDAIVEEASSVAHSENRNIRFVHGYAALGVEPLVRVRRNDWRPEQDCYLLNAAFTLRGISLKFPWNCISAAWNTQYPNTPRTKEQVRNRFRIICKYALRQGWIPPIQGVIDGAM